MSDRGPSPGAAQAAGEERRVITQRSLNDDILRLIDRPGPVWIAAFALDLVVLLIGALALRNEVVTGLGVGGWTRPVMWASYITNFVFWVGIAHCGTLVSAILFLFRSHFRRAVYRVAEAMTVFGDLLDPESAVARLSADERRYWVFNELNTKPAVTYLKKLERESELA